MKILDCQITHNGDPAQDANFEESDPDHDPRVFYTCQDIQSNVIGLLLGNSQQQFAGHLPGDLIERYTYDPYGSRDVYAPEDVSDPCECIDKLDAFVDRINNVNIPYNPFSTNSNAFAHQAISEIGLGRPDDLVWSPGAGTELPDN